MVANCCSSGKIALDDAKIECLFVTLDEAEVEPVYQLTSHAAAAALKRKIDMAWIERALAEPDWTQTDPAKPGVMHAFLRIAERNHRVLRVVYNPTVHPVRVITACFDRRLRGRP